jgi:excisionase family DNA binding protein
VAISAPLEQEVSELRAKLDRLGRQIEQLTALVLVQGSTIAELRAAGGLNQTESDEQPITLKEAAFRTGYSESNIRRLISEEVIVAKKIGGHVLVDAKTLPIAKLRVARKP